MWLHVMNTIWNSLNKIEIKQDAHANWYVHLVLFPNE